MYYSYAIIKQSRWEVNEPWESEILFSQYCDECSIIYDIGQICLLLSKGIEEFKRKDGILVPLLNDCKHVFGMGTDWLITKHTCIEYGYEEEDEDIETIYYHFMLFKYNGVGFKFSIKKESTIQRFLQFHQYHYLALLQQFLHLHHHLRIFLQELQQHHHLIIRF